MTRQTIFMCVDELHEDQAIVTLESLRDRNVDHIQKIIFVVHQPSDRLIDYTQNIVGNCMIIRIQDDLASFLPEPYASKPLLEQKEVALKLAMLHGMAILTDLEYDVGIYLDLTVLVNGDLSEMLRAKLNDSYLAVASARPYGDSTIRHFYTKYEKNFKQNEEISSESNHYFNSGVIVWNLDQMAEDGITGDDFIRGGYNSLRHDAKPVQDYLNRFFNGRSLVKMPRTFNAVPCETIVPFVAYNMTVGHNIKLSCSSVINYTDRFAPWKTDIPKDKFFLQVPMRQYWSMVQQCNDYLSPEFVANVKSNYDSSEAMCGKFLKPFHKTYGKPLA